MKVSIIPWIVRKLKLCFALVEDGDTASQNIAQGKFVIWKGVCCKAASAITAGETLSGTNLPAISGGALNDIGSDVSTLNSNIANLTKITLTSVQITNGTGQINGIAGYRLVAVTLVAADDNNNRQYAVRSFVQNASGNYQLTCESSYSSWTNMRAIWIKY